MPRTNPDAPRPRARALGALLLVGLCGLPVAGSAAPPRQPPGSLAGALERAAGGEWDRLHLLVECREEGRMTSVELFGDGVGIWNGARQFALPRAELAGLLRRAGDAGFATMPGSFGGTRARSERRPPRATCRVALRLDGHSKQVVQLLGGEQSSALRRFAGAVLDTCRGPARAGLAAASLEEGLALLVAGALAPEAFTLRLHRRVETAAGGLGPGWQLRLRGRRAELRSNDGATSEVELPDGDLKALARVLIASGAGGLPVNLHADHYTDLTASVLDREAHVLARRFAGMTPASRGEPQERFDRIVAAVLALRERLFDAGPGGGASRKKLPRGDRLNPRSSERYGNGATEAPRTPRTHRDGRLK